MTKDERRERSRNYYIKNRDRLREASRQYATRRRRLKGVPCKREEMEARARAKEELRLAREAQRAALAEQRREARLETWRRNARTYRALHPELKREQDRRYRKANRDKVQAGQKIRKQRAAQRGYRWQPKAEYRERQRRRNLAITAAFQYLCSIGLAQWWGPRETTNERREAAYAYVKAQGLVTFLSPAQAGPPRSAATPAGSRSPLVMLER